MKNTVDNGRFSCVMFMDLSKVVDKINHNFPIAELGAYGFQENAPYFIKSYTRGKDHCFIIFMTYCDVLFVLPCSHLFYQFYCFFCLSI